MRISDPYETVTYITKLYESIVFYNQIASLPNQPWAQRGHCSPILIKVLVQNVFLTEGAFLAYIVLLIGHLGC